MTLAVSLRRGLLAGLLGGLLAGLFALVMGEGPLEQAIHLEDAASASNVEDAGAPQDAELQISRATQRLGLVAASGLVGVTLGGLFGGLFAAVQRGRAASSPWLVSLHLGVAVWLAVAVLPSLKYPANPPGVGDPTTVGARSVWYLIAVLLSAAAALATWAVNGRLRHRGVPVAKRHLLSGAVAVAGAALVTALPANPDPIRVPADLLWNFRLSAFATTATLWLSIAVAFGLLGERAAHREAG